MDRRGATRAAQALRQGYTERARAGDALSVHRATISIAADTPFRDYVGFTVNVASLVEGARTVSEFARPASPHAQHMLTLMHVFFALVCNWRSVVAAHGDGAIHASKLRPTRRGLESGAHAPFECPRPVRDHVFAPPAPTASCGGDVVEQRLQEDAAALAESAAPFDDAPMRRAMQSALDAMIPSMAPARMPTDTSSDDDGASSAGVRTDCSDADDEIPDLDAARHGGGGGRHHHHDDALMDEVEGARDRRRVMTYFPFAFTDAEAPKSPRDGLPPHMPDATLFCEVGYEAAAAADGDEEAAETSQPMRLQAAIECVLECTQHNLERSVPGVSKEDVALRTDLAADICDAALRIIDDYDVEATEGGEGRAAAQRLRDAVGRMRAQVSETGAVEHDEASNAAALRQDAEAATRWLREDAQRRRAADRAPDWITFHFLMNNAVDINVILLHMLAENAHGQSENPASAALSFTRNYLAHSVPFRVEDEEGDDDDDDDDEEQGASSIRDLAGDGAQRRRRRRRGRQQRSTCVDNMRFSGPRMGREARRAQAGQLFRTVTVDVLGMLRDLYCGDAGMAQHEASTWRVDTGEHNLPTMLEAQNLFSLANALAARDVPEASPHSLETWMSTARRRRYGGSGGDDGDAAASCPYFSGRYDGEGMLHMRFPTRRMVLVVPPHRCTYGRLLCTQVPRKREMHHHPVFVAVGERLRDFDLTGVEHLAPRRTHGGGADAARRLGGGFEDERLASFVVFPDTTEEAEPVFWGVLDEWCRVMERARSVVDDICGRIEGRERRRALVCAHNAWVLEQFEAMRVPRDVGMSMASRTIYHAWDEKGYGRRPARTMRTTSTRFSPGANAVVCMTQANWTGLFMAYPHLLMAIFVQAMQAYDRNFGNPHGNMVLCGPGGTSKSHLVRMLARLLIGDNHDNSKLRTCTLLTRVSGCGFENRQDPIMNDQQIIIEEECPMGRYQSAEEDGAGDSRFKSMLTSNRIVAHVFNPELNRTVEYTMLMRTTFLGCINWSIVNVEKSMLQRAIFAFVYNNPRLITEQRKREKQAKAKGMGARRFAPVLEFYPRMQALAHDVYLLLNACYVRSVNSLLLTSLFDCINAHLEEAGYSVLEVRDQDIVSRYATVLCMLDWYANQYLMQGSPHAGRPMRTEHLRSLEAHFYLQPQHVVHAIGVLVPYLTRAGDAEIRAALWNIHKRHVASYVGRMRNYHRFLPMDAPVEARMNHETGRSDLGQKKDLSDDHQVDLDANRYFTTVSEVHPAVTVHPRARGVHRLGGDDDGDEGRERRPRKRGSDRRTEKFDAAHYDFDYVRFPLQGSGGPIAILAGMVLNELHNMGARKLPSREQLVERLEVMQRSRKHARPMKHLANGDVFACVAPDMTAPKRHFAVLIVNRSAQQVLVHYDSLKNRSEARDIVKQALLDFFNRSNEVPQDYIYGVGGCSTYDVLRLGRGYAPSRRLGRKSTYVEPGPANPDALEPMTLQNVSRVSSVEHDLFSDLVTPSGGAAVASADCIRLDVDCATYVAQQRLEELGWSTPHMTPANVAWALAHVGDWLAGRYGARDDRRFHEVPEAELDETTRNASRRRLLTRLRRRGIVYQAPDDLLVCHDMHPDDHMVRNPMYRAAEAAHPLLNAERVAAWCALGLTREQYKMCFTSPAIIRRVHALAVSRGVDESYPCATVVGMKRVREAQGVETSAPRKHSKARRVDGGDVAAAAGEDGSAASVVEHSDKTVFARNRRFLVNPANLEASGTDAPAGAPSEGDMYALASAMTTTTTTTHSECSRRSSTLSSNARRRRGGGGPSDMDILAHGLEATQRRPQYVRDDVAACVDDDLDDNEGMY